MLSCAWRITASSTELNSAMTANQGMVAPRKARSEATGETYETRCGDPVGEREASRPP